MKYSVDKKSASPAYMQIYEQIRRDVTDGILRRGDKLPSKRLTAEELGVSVVTVEHAYAILCDEGYVASAERSGYYVIYRERDFSARPERAEPVAAAFAVPQGTPRGGEFPYPSLARAMRKVLSERGESILVKSPNRGVPELRGAVAEYLARSGGISVDAGQIVIGSGAEYLYGLIVQLLGVGRIYAVEDPSYEKIRLVYGALGAKTELLRMGGNGIASSELERSRAGVLHVTPFNSYPSGITADASKRREYLSWAKERGAYIIEDNFDSEMTVSRKNEDTVFSLDDSGRVIYLNTFSRTVAPSIRVGYMVLPPDLAAEFDEKLGFYSCTVPVFEQYVLAHLISDGEFERHINRVRRAKRRGGS